MKTVINKPELATLCADAISELERACRKHQEWPDKLTTCNADDVKIFLHDARKTNDNGQATAGSIFDEEYYEFIEAVMQGDAKAARHELTQAIAMLLRQYAHLDDFIKQYKSAKE